MAKKDVKMTTVQNEEVIAAAVPEKELPMDNVEESFEDNAAADAAIMMPQAKKDKKQLIHDLVEMGRAKGKLTTQEILDSMEDLEFDPEQMDKLYEMLENQNIEIVDDFASETFEDLDFVLDVPEGEDSQAVGIADGAAM